VPNKPCPIDLDKLEHLRKDGLSDMDPAKLYHCACAIPGCANTDKFFDAGEGDRGKTVDDMEFKAPGFMEASEKTPEDIADGSALPSFDGADFMLAVRITDGPLPSRLMLQPTPS
jgi:hypothetical protein